MITAANRLLMRLAESGFEVVGSVSGTFVNGAAWSSALDFSSIPVRAGDIGIVAFGADGNGDGSWSWSATGVQFTNVMADNTGNNRLFYAAYEVLDGVDTGFFPTGVSGWNGVAVCFTVIRAVPNAGTSANANASSGSPNPPAVSAAGDPLLNVVFAMGYVRNTSTALTPPAGYTTAIAEQANFGTSDATVSIAYIFPAGSGTINPGSFGAASGEWYAATIEFYP
jgi:hypothetical protein